MPFVTEDLPSASTQPPNTPSKQLTHEMPSREFVSYDVSARNQGAVRQETPSEPAAVPADPGESIKLSPKISALARKEQAFRQKEAQLKQREQQLEQKLADAERFSKLKERMAAKDYSAAEELGLSYDEYTKHLIDKQTATDPNEQRYKKVESELESLKKAQEDRIVQEYKENQAAWKAEVARVVSSGEEDFSTIRELKMEDAVLRHINDSFDEDGIELTAEQAAKEIEAALIERAERFSNVTKIQKKRALGPPKVSGPKTLTQEMTVTSTTPASRPFHMLSESEQIAEAYRRVQAAKLQR